MSNLELLFPLLRYFVRKPIQVNAGVIFIDMGWQRQLEISQPSEQYLLVCTRFHWGRADGSASTYDLDDPNSIPAVVRAVCRRLGDDVPSFWSIDLVLKEGVPAWMLED